MDPLEKFTPQQIAVLGQLEMIRQSLALAAERAQQAYNALAIEPGRLTPSIVIDECAAVHHQVEQQGVGLLHRATAELAVSLMKQGGSK